jgi:hypothetical protein
MLMSPEGKWIGATHGGNESFNFSLLLREGFLLPGTYIVQVDPSWNDSANFHKDYKNVMVDIYCPQQNLNI